MKDNKISPKDWNRARKRVEWKKAHEHGRRVDDYNERESQIWTRKSNWVCISCRKTAKLYDHRDISDGYPAKCPHCGEKTLHKVGTKVRAPRKNASNRVWSEFEKRFYLS